MSSASLDKGLFSKKSHECENPQFFLILQPKSDVDLKARKGKEINIDNFKNFHARRRWKHSMKVVSLCNKLSRSKQKLGLETDSAEIVVQPETVVSNNTTGKTAEVSFKSVQKRRVYISMYFWQHYVSRFVITPGTICIRDSRSYLHIQSIQSSFDEKIMRGARFDKIIRLYF